MIIAIAILWVMLGIFAYGFLFAYFQGMFPALAKEDYSEDKSFCLMFVIFGPLYLISVLVFLFVLENGAFYGFKIK